MLVSCFRKGYSLSLAYSWEIAQCEHAQKTGFSTCTVSDDDELPPHNILSLLFRHGRSSGVSLHNVSQDVQRLMGTISHRSENQNAECTVHWTLRVISRVMWSRWIGENWARVDQPGERPSRSVDCLEERMQRGESPASKAELGMGKLADRYKGPCVQGGGKRVRYCRLRSGLRILYLRMHLP